MNIFQEYPKAITVIVLGLIYYFVKPLIPEFFTAEIQTALEFVIDGLVVFLIGRFTRLNKTEANKLNDPYRQ